MTTESCDGQLIQLRGRLLDFQAGLGPRPHRLEIDCGDSVTTAFLSGETRELAPGTELQGDWHCQARFLRARRDSESCDA